MSLVQLTLRPPPHVDFVTGYPGIPPNGTDRPQAAVKGALEIRVPSQGAKAQWVKIELRKVETLPGGGQGNTFYDVVGPGTVTLWTSGGAEYEVLHARDFPFSIRIPEAVPPSLQLEQRAGIHYELVATVCTKGKKSFFRKRKHAIASTTAAVIIDKHDLHSTWPVYCQPETRQIVQEGIKLSVDRNQSCYGPGDRMAVTATIKSESTHTVMLRSFEILLKETISFRGHMFVAGKKGEPLTRSTIITENRFQVNTPMYGGMQATQDLFCMLSATHTNTTLSAARHIDITYSLVVKAHLGAGMPLLIELPVIISNWQRAVSLEAMRRIGPAPGLSMITAPGPGGVNPLTQQPITRVDPIPPVGTPIQPRPSTANEAYGTGSSRRPTHAPSDSQTSANEFGGWSSSRGGGGSVGGSRPTVGAGKRPPSAGSHSPKTQRFTITNALPEDSQSSQQRKPSASGANEPWLTATEEKKRYADAKKRVEQTQINFVPESPPPPEPPAPQVTPPQPKATSRDNMAYLTAEEEKLRLFQNAQAAVARTQYGAAPVAVDPTPAPAPVSSTSKQPSAAAVMYSQAVSAMRNESIKAQQQPQSSSSSSVPKVTNPSPSPAKGRVPGYLTAEEEKAALRRYEEAKKAVDRVQGSGYYEDDPPVGTTISGLVPYDSLFPSGPAGGSGAASSAHVMAPPPANDLPPPFEAGPPMTAPQQLSEKERLRRQYEAQDVAAGLSRQTTATATATTPTPARVASPQVPLSRQGSAVAPPPLQGGSPPPFSSGPAYNSAASEKEALRRRFEAQDSRGVGDWQTVTPPQTPPRSTPPPSSLRGRPTPLPPSSSSSSGQRILTAAEEKAMLRARYEAQDTSGTGGAPPPMYVNGYGNGALNSAGSSNGGVAPSTYSGLSYTTGPGSPPPLMPRPPQDYIMETQEEDARVARMTMNGMAAKIEDEPEGSPRADVVRALTMKNMNGNGSMPSLPPKPLGD